MAGRPTGERGFTVIEVLIALLVLLLGMAGILSLQLTSVEATAFSRHATEASILGEDKMEWLRTQQVAPLVALCPDTDPLPPPPDCTEQVDALGQLDPEGLYTRTWKVVPAALVPTVNVTIGVSWLEQGRVDEPYTVALSTQRAP